MRHTRKCFYGLSAAVISWMYVGFFESDPVKLIALLMALGGGLPIAFVLSGYVALVDEGGEGRMEGGVYGGGEDGEDGEKTQLTASDAFSSNAYVSGDGEQRTSEPELLDGRFSDSERAPLSSVASDAGQRRRQAVHGGDAARAHFVSHEQEHARLLSAFVMIFVLALIIFIVSLFKAFEPAVFTPAVNEAIALCFALYVLSFVSIGLPLSCWDSAPRFLGVSSDPGRAALKEGACSDAYERVEGGKEGGVDSGAPTGGGESAVSCTQQDESSENSSSMTLLQAAQTKECEYGVCLQRKIREKRSRSRRMGGRPEVMMSFDRENRHLPSSPSPARNTHIHGNSCNAHQQIGCSSSLQQLCAVAASR